jgi:hypothetical protein
MLVSELSRKSELADAGKPAREQLKLIRIFEELRAVGY